MLVLILLIAALVLFVVAFAWPPISRVGWLGLACVTLASLLGQWHG